ncbi:MAG: winged helix-turn-helix domain-containing protein [bacterium]
MATRQRSASSARNAGSARNASSGRRQAAPEIGFVDGRPRVLVIDESPPTPHVALVMEALASAGVDFETVVPSRGGDRSIPDQALRYDVVVASPHSGALGMRPPSPPNGNLPDVESGRLRIDGQRRTVEVDGAVVPMSAREYTLLHYLASRPNVVFTREALLLAVWGSWRTEGSVTEYVRRVRMLLEPHGIGRCIVTRKGFGYAFDPDLVN